MLAPMYRQWYHRCERVKLARRSLSVQRLWWSINNSKRLPFRLFVWRLVTLLSPHSTETSLIRNRVPFPVDLLSPGGETTEPSGNHTTWFSDFCWSVFVSTSLFTVSCPVGVCCSSREDRNNEAIVWAVWRWMNSAGQRSTHVRAEGRLGDAAEEKWCWDGPWSSPPPSQMNSWSSRGRWSGSTDHWDRGRPRLVPHEQNYINIQNKKKTIYIDIFHILFWWYIKSYHQK